MAKHIFKVGDRVRDSRDHTRVGTVVETDIADIEEGTEYYDIDDENCAFNGWSDWPYRILWDGTVGATWIDSEYAEPIEEVSDKIVNDPSVSRRHAKVSRAAEGGLQIEDLNSAYGTKVNDETVAAFQARPLGIGDKVTMGAVTLDLSQMP